PGRSGPAPPHGELPPPRRRLNGLSSCYSLLPWVRRLAAPRLPVILDVPLEGARLSELAQFVTNHGFADEHRDVLAPVVHREGVADHVRDYRRPARPGLDHGLLTRLVERVHL